MVRVLLAVVGLASTAFAQSEPRVILVSWDGAGYVMTSRLLAEDRLPNLRRLVNEGAWSDGMVSSFPTKTAAAHAVFFTGHYGHANGITGNYLLKSPPVEHTRLETARGYSSDPLRVDPVWVRAVRAGLNTFTFHATQSYPCAAALRRLEWDERDRLFLVHGYTEVRLRGESLNEASIAVEPPTGWTVPEAFGAEARAFRFAVGDTSFWGLFFDDPLDPTPGCDTLGVVRHTDASEFEARVKSGDAGGFSIPIEASSSGTPVWFSLRLFDVSAGGDRFLLYRSGAVELALSNRDTPRADELVMQVYAGNGGTRVYASGGFGPVLARGGDGSAEARFLETLEHLQEQIIRQARVALEEDYRLLVLYSPVSDDAAHELAGYTEPGLVAYDAELATRVWETLARAFELQDRFLGVILEAAERDGAHVVLVSDHGMVGTDKLVHVNVALHEAGLLALRPDRSIDLSATRALAPPLDDMSIAVNTVERAGGVVPIEEREAVLTEVRRALGALTDAETGEPIVTNFFEPATSGLLQPGGSSTGDLFLDFAPGYYPSTDTDNDVIVEATEPRGNHGFAPTRRDMLAICAAWGPRIGAGTNFGKVRAIDVTPTVLDLLELGAGGLPGRTLAPARTLLKTAR